MIRKYVQLALVLFFTFTKLAAQSDADKFSAAALYVDEGRYSLALPLWLELYAKDPSNQNINYNLGLCYLHSASEKSKATSYLEQAITKTTGNYLDLEPEEKKAPHKAYYYLAQAYHSELKFDEAIAMFTKYKDLAKKKADIPQVDREIAWATYAKEMIKHPVHTEIENLGDSINTKFPEYSALISADESTIIFTSRREGDQLNPNDNLPFEDIYVSYRTDDDKWSKAKSIGTNINSSGNEASVALSADGQQLIIYRDDAGDGNLYISTLDGDVWSYPVKLGSDINTKYFEPSASFSADGNTIYFVSDRPGGFGGLDIYRVVKLPNGQWSLAQNLGPTINTPFDEDGPYIHPDGNTLYFSSKGHQSIGGYDVLYSMKDEEGKWSVPNNLGFPVNTTDDDVFYITSLDGKRSYYSSGKHGGLGDKDIYMITLPDVIVEKMALLKGSVSFDGKFEIPADANINVTELSSGNLVGDFKPRPKNGSYIMILSPGKKERKYVFSYTAKGYHTVTDTVTLSPEMSYQSFNNEVRLKNVNLVSQASGTVALLGTVTTPDGKAVKGVKIIVKDNQNGELVSTLTPASDNSYYVVVQKGKNYNISFEAAGYLFQSENINVPSDKNFSDIRKDIQMQPIKVGAKVVLNNIFFDSGKSTLRKESKLELEKLYKLLNEQPAMKIEVSGHTDNKGNAKSNLALSQQRANAVTNFLVKKGIAKTRIISKGYGQEQPLVPNTLSNGKPDVKGMQMNRRVEFKILSTE
jgi:outer membrane protein OmpA-like peptidoglycan-associated protein